MKPAIEANSRHIRLARRALRAAQTHLRNAANRTSMPETSRERCKHTATDLDVWVHDVDRLEAEANAHLVAMVRSRRE